MTDRGEGNQVLIFDDLTGELMEADLRGMLDEVVQRLTRADKTGTSEGSQKHGPGRPRLGVIPREATLLPGQWDWLDGQPGGASAALRRLVYKAKRSGQGKDRARQSQDAVYRFMTVMAGNFPGFEEALRAFYRRDRQRFSSIVESWPKDVSKHVERLVAIASLNQTTAEAKSDECPRG